MNGPRLSVYAERLVRAGIALQVAALEWDRRELEERKSLLALEAIHATVGKILGEIKKEKYG